MKRFQCPDCGFVWFYPLHYINFIDKYKEHTSFWYGEDDRINTCPDCGYTPFSEFRWWLQSWRPDADNYWRKSE